MTPAPGTGPQRRPYWLLVVFAALMLSPPAWAAAALIGSAIAVVLAGGVRRALARPAREAELPPGTALTTLGTDASGNTVRVSDRQLSAHGLILGASGAGKSTTLLAILTDHVRRGRPVIALDMKGSPEFAQRLAEAAADAGRRLVEWTPDGPSHWNPLAHGNATELKDKLISTERFTEPHYQRAAERYVQCALGVLHDVHPGQPPTLEDVVRMMDPGRLAITLRDLPPARAERVHEYLAGLTADQLSAVRGLGTRLAIITESHTGPFLGAAPGGPGATGATMATGATEGAAGRNPRAGTIDLRRALAGDEVALFSLNSSTYGTFSAQLGALVIQDLKAAVGHRLAAIERLPPDRRPPPALVGLDEFSALGADNVISLLARARAAGVSVLLATQEMADLDRAAPGLRDQVVGNTAIKIAHRQDVPASANAVAQMAGTVKRWEETRQIGGRLLGSHETGRGTRRQVEEFRVHPNEIKTLRTGQAVVLVKTPRAAVRTVDVTPPRAGPRTADVTPPRAGPRREGRELG